MLIEPNPKLAKNEAELIMVQRSGQVLAPSTLATARSWFAKRPDRVEMLGNLAALALEVWMSRAAADMPVIGTGFGSGLDKLPAEERGPVLVGEGLRRHLKNLRGELLGPAPSPLERLLVERILLSWLQVHRADMDLAQYGGSLEGGTYRQRQVDRSQRRYLHAVKSLAQVRRLLVPAIQVNIAERQLNVGTAVKSQP